MESKTKPVASIHKNSNSHPNPHRNKAVDNFETDAKLPQIKKEIPKSNLPNNSLNNKLPNNQKVTNKNLSSPLLNKPKSPPVEETENIPKKKSVILLFILQVITFQIYQFFWYIRRAPELNNLRTLAKASKSWPIVGLILCILVLALSVTLNFLPGGTDIAKIEEMPPVAYIVTIILLILTANLIIIMIINAFHTRHILNQALKNKGSKARLSRLFTLVFNFFYLQYEINRIIEDREDQSRKGPWVFFVLLLLLIIGSVIGSIITLLMS